MAKTRKRTPKERVLARYPQAHCVLAFTSPDGFHQRIHKEFGGTVNVGSGKNATAAWADAAKRLKP